MKASGSGGPSGGIRSVNFFNGRLLTGEDLSREQDANELARLRLGRAVGSGVAYGLEVAQAPTGSTTERPIVTIESVYLSIAARLA